jgi:2-iminobutanoate/2-iminopropanoate deaminase
MDWQLKKYPMYYRVNKKPYSKTAVVGNLIFCSAMDGTALKTGKVTSHKIEEQMTVVLNKIKEAIEEAGGSLDNLVSTDICLRSMQDHEHLREAEQEFFRKYAPSLALEPPASRVIQSDALVNPESLVEVDAVGAISMDKPEWRVTKYPMYCGGVKQPYSKSAAVGNLLFCSGMDGIDLDTGKVTSNDVAGQMLVALNKLKNTLKEAGATLDNTIKTTIMLKDLKDYARMRETEVEYYQDHARFLVGEPPASTFMKSGALVNDGCLVEILATAIVSKKIPEWEMIKYPEYCEGKKTNVPWVPTSWPHLSKAVVVGNLIISSGSAARTSKSPDTIGTDIKEQMKVTLGVTKDMLEDIGGSMNDIVKYFIILKDIKDYQLMREAELEYYREHAPGLLVHPPVNTVIQNGLARPDYLVEMDTYALLR